MSMSRWGVTPPLKPPVGSGYNVLQYTVVQEDYRLVMLRLLAISTRLDEDEFAELLSCSHVDQCSKSSSVSRVDGLPLSCMTSRFHCEPSVLKSQNLPCARRQPPSCSPFAWV